ncbi:MAG: asparagine synthase-related protein, partial [Myxococcota bacterium]
QNTVLLHLKLNPRRELSTLIRCYGQPYADPVALRSLAVARLLRPHVRAILTGLGGEAILGGRGYDWALVAADVLRWLPSDLFRPASRLLGRRQDRNTRPGQMQRLMASAGRRPDEHYLAWATTLLTKEEKQRWWRSSAVRPTDEWLQTVLPLGLGSLDTQLSGEQRTSLVSSVLMNLDTATMAAGIEGRAPMMDHPLVEFAATLPDTLRTQPSVLAQTDPVPDGWPPPPSVFITGWMRGSLRPWVLDTLGQSNAEVRTWLRDELVDGLIDGKLLPRRRAHVLYALLVLELWLRHNRLTPSSAS